MGAVPIVILRRPVAGNEAHCIHDAGSQVLMGKIDPCVYDADTDSLPHCFPPFKRRAGHADPIIYYFFFLCGLDTDYFIITYCQTDTLQFLYIMLTSL